MTSKEYQELCKRSAPNDLTPVKSRLNYNTCMIDLIHAQLGMTTEVGEFSDSLKKFIIYGQRYDLENGIEELGDLMWYISLAATSLGVTLEYIMQQNIEKLRIRYPEQFTEFHAKERLDKK